MSIAQKGQTWLPRFWRKPETASSSLMMAERSMAGDGSVDESSLSLHDSRDGIVVGRSVVRPSVVSASPDASAVSPKVHPLACVDPRAELADGVEVGPFCVVGPEVRIGRNTRLMNNVTVLGRTTIGADNVCFPNAVLGTMPQDKKFRGEETRLEIGDNNHLRENVTIHLGTDTGGGVTRVGSGNLLMVNVHLGHDVAMGDNCVLANNVMIAGHVHIGNNVVMSGAAGCHHFVTVGDFVYASGQCQISHDVPPFVKVDGSDRIRCVNSVGLRRNGFTNDDVSAIEQIVWRLFLDRDRKPVNVTLREFRAGGLPEIATNPNVLRVVEFLERRNLGRHGRYLESLRAG